MTEYISREDAINSLQSRLDSIDQMSYLSLSWQELDIMRDAIRDAIDDIEEVSTANVQSLRQGRWLDIYEYCKLNGYTPSGMGSYHWCSECMKAQEKISDFCPCCGADMRER